jgi:hypothetical protein
MVAEMLVGWQQVLVGENQDGDHATVVRESFGSLVVRASGRSLIRVRSVGLQAREPQRDPLLRYVLGDLPKNGTRSGGLKVGKALGGLRERRTLIGSRRLLTARFGQPLSVPVGQRTGMSETATVIWYVCVYVCIYTCIYLCMYACTGLVSE